MAVKKDFTSRRTVPKLGVVGKATGVLVVLVSVFVGWLAVGGIVDGTLPFLHIVEPHGFSEKDMEKTDLSGKSVLVTGASSGLGLGVARSLARHGADLVVTARDSIKCEATLAALRKHAGQAAKVRCVEMELMSLVGTRAAAQQLAETVLPKLDYLVLNAGIMAPPTQLLSVDGNEAQFQVNHLSQFLLLKALIPSLLKSESTPTVVTVSSAAHWGAHSAGAEPLTSDALNNKALYNPSTFYGWSKLANILTARHLTRLYPSIKTHAIHPGGVKGKLLRYVGGDGDNPSNLAKHIESLIYWDIDTAAFTVLGPLLGSGEAFRGTGKYYVPIARERSSSMQAQDPELAKRLWGFSEELLRAE